MLALQPSGRDPGPPSVTSARWPRTRNFGVS